MKLKVLLLALFTAGFAVSIAVAASPAAIDNKGKPTTSTSTDGSTTSASHEKREGKGDRKSEGKGERKGEGKREGKSKSKLRSEESACKRARNVIVTGEFVAAGPGGFAMLVTRGNRAGKAWKGKQATVLVDDRTRFKGKTHTLADLVAGDRLLVQGRACRVEAADGSTAPGSLLARKVTSKRQKAPKDGGESTTTATTTTEPTTTEATTTGTP